MSVRLSEVIVAAAGRHAPLAGETAGYIVLAMADQLVAAPRLVALEATCLEATGAVRVAGAAADSNVSSVALRQALAELLGVARPVPPALRRVAAGARADGVPGLVRELEAALIPVNRSAAGRALARLQRETARARDAGVLVAVEPAEPQAQVEAPPAVVVADDADTPVDALPPVGVGTISALPAPPVVEVSPEPPVVKTAPARPAPPPRRSPRPPPVVEVSPPPPVVETAPAPPVVEVSPEPPVVQTEPAPPVVEVTPTPAPVHVSPPPLPPPTPEPPTIDHVAIGLAQFRVSPGVTDTELRAALLDYSGIERSLQI
jgi:hypothetical protein